MRADPKWDAIGELKFCRLRLGTLQWPSAGGSGVVFATSVYLLVVFLVAGFSGPRLIQAYPQFAIHAAVGLCVFLFLPLFILPLVASPRRAVEEAMVSLRSQLGALRPRAQPLAIECVASVMSEANSVKTAGWMWVDRDSICFVGDRFDFTVNAGVANIHGSSNKLQLHVRPPCGIGVRRVVLSPLDAESQEFRRILANLSYHRGAAPSSPRNCLLPPWTAAPKRPSFWKSGLGGLGLGILLVGMPLLVTAPVDGNQRNLTTSAVMILVFGLMAGIVAWIPYWEALWNRRVFERARSSAMSAAGQEMPRGS